MTTVQKILSVLGWIGTALVFGAVVVRFTRPEWDQYAIYAVWVGLALVILYTAGQWREIVAFFRTRQGRYGTLAGVSVLVALAIVVAVNYLASRQNKRWDFTESRQNSLSEQTVKVLQSLDSPVKFTVFDKQGELERYRTRLDEYGYQSKQVTTEYIDPDRRPVVAREYQVDRYGTIVVDYKGRRERATSDAEQDLTNAIIKATSGTTRMVYFTQGHGEKDPTSTERNGYSAVTQTLGRDNYKVDRLVLAQQRDVPENATVVVVAGPTTDLLAEEADALRRYLAKAGKVMILIDPAIGAAAKPMPILDALLKEWDIAAPNTVIVDISGATNEPSIAVANTYPAHPITDRFDTLTLFPLARSIQAIPGGVGGHNAQPVVETSQRSWAETNLSSLDSGQGVAMEEDKGDQPGPVTLAAAVSAPVGATPEATAPAANEAPKPESRLVVFGDSDFASNAYGGVAGNPNLFANAVNWLAQQENLIAIRPTQSADRRVTLTAMQSRAIGWISVVVIPAFVFGTGIYTWWRRR